MVITGGSRGIGRAMALEFLKKGWRVSIAGRDQESVTRTADELCRESDTIVCHGFVCDVTDPEEVRLLWKNCSLLQPVDAWINNAGINHSPDPFTELDPALTEQVLDTNLLGTIWGSRVAIEGMVERGSGMLFNMEGFGSDGRIMKGMSIYGTSKRAVRYFTRSLIKEYKHSGVLVGTISPGMVVTDMLLGPVREDPLRNLRALKIFHMLADTPERVAPWIVSRIAGTRKHGRHIAWLTRRRVIWRFLTGTISKRKVPGLPSVEG